MPHNLYSNVPKRVIMQIIGDEEIRSIKIIVIADYFDDTYQVFPCVGRTDPVLSGIQSI